MASALGVHQGERLPLYWVSSLDTKYNRVYYFNTKTKESTWEKPIESSVSVSGEKSIRGGSKEHGYYLRAVGKGDGALPHGWVEGFSSEYNRKYYYNVQTMESFWEIPKQYNAHSERNSRLNKLYEAWQNLEDARKELQAEREHEKQLLSTLKDRIQRLQEITKETSFRPQNVPDDFSMDTSTVEEEDVSILRLRSELEEYARDLEHRTSTIKDSHSPSQYTTEDKDGNTSLVPYSYSKEGSDLQGITVGMKAVKAELKAQTEAIRKATSIKEGDYYRILKVRKGASKSQLRKAYHKLMIRWHPDKNQDNIGHATKQANLVQDAYAVLSDDWERTVYDAFGLKQYLVHAQTVKAIKSYLITGVAIKKHGRNDKRSGIKSLGLTFYQPRKRILWLDFNGKSLNIGQKRILEVKNEKELAGIKKVDIDEITGIRRGMSTEVFQRTGNASRSSRYFSIISDSRTLDLEAESAQQCDFLASRLTLLILDLQKNEHWLREYYMNLSG